MVCPHAHAQFKVTVLPQTYDLVCLACQRILTTYPNVEQPAEAITTRILARPPFFGDEDDTPGEPPTLSQEAYDGDWECADAIRDAQRPPLQVVPLAGGNTPCTSGCPAPAVLSLEVLRYGVEDIHLCQECADLLRHELMVNRANVP